MIVCSQKKAVQCLNLFCLTKSVGSVPQFLFYKRWTVALLCSCSDPGDQNRDGGQQRNSLCQGCPAALVPDEDCRVSSERQIQETKAVYSIVISEIEWLSHNPSGGFDRTLFQKSYERWSVERNKLFFHPIKIVLPTSNMMFVILKDNFASQESRSLSHNC